MKVNSSAAVSLLLSSFLFAGCALIPAHQFAAPGHDWRTRTGQLAFHGKKRTVIGEVLVRSSGRGDFELSFSKGPGLILLMVRSDPAFARVQGPLAGVPWSGPISAAPPRVRPWFKLREEILRNPEAKILRVTDEAETLVLRF